MWINANAGEIAAMKELNKRGFYYQWLSHHQFHKHDILAIKNDTKIRIEVKSCMELNIYPNKNLRIIRDTAGSGREYKSRIDFFIVAIMQDSPWINPKEFWVIPTYNKKPNDKVFLNNFDLLEKFKARR